MYNLNNTEDLDIVNDLNNTDKLAEQNSPDRRERKENRDRQY